MTTPLLDLAGLRADRAALVGLLESAGAEFRGDKCRCIFHDDRTPSAGVYESDGGWRFKCHGCGVGGDYVDVLALVNKSDARTEIKRIKHYFEPAARERELRGKADPVANLPQGTKARDEAAKVVNVSPRSVEHASRVPVVDVARMQRFSEALSRRQIEHADTQTAPLAARGISREIACAYGISHFDTLRFAEWAREITDVWAIPIPTPDSEYRGVKLHRERVENGPKCLWAPFGIGKGKGAHIYSALWPPVQWFCPSEWVAITEGELKAAALLSASRNATSPTTGASTRWTDALVAPLFGRRVVIVHDGDEAGERFRDNLVRVLQGRVAALRVLTFNEVPA
ncbi:MAG: hypothetical protein HS116_05245 [Planctomycetes bacterium]|nr:hypothetical protein [Planctomycetota bacterium]